MALNPLVKAVRSPLWLQFGFHLLKWCWRRTWSWLRSSNFLYHEQHHVFLKCQQTRPDGGEMLRVVDKDSVLSLVQINLHHYKAAAAELQLTLSASNIALVPYPYLVNHRVSRIYDKNYTVFAITIGDKMRTWSFCNWFDISEDGRRQYRPKWFTFASVEMVKHLGWMAYPNWRNATILGLSKYYAVMPFKCGWAVHTH